MRHLDENTIFRYISNIASEQEHLQVDTHIADCPECLQQVRSLLFIRKNFEGVWKSWTAVEHGRVCRQWKLINKVMNEKR